MKNEKKTKKRTAVKVMSGAVVGVMLFGTGVYAATQLLNWTGNQTMVDTGIFLDQVANKLVKSEGEKNQAIVDKGQLEDQIKDLEEQIKDLEDQIANGGGSDDGWTEKDQQIVDLKNELIQKQNDIDHLTRELQRANDAAVVIQGKLDSAKSKLEEAGINIWN